MLLFPTTSTDHFRDLPRGYTPDPDFDTHPVDLTLLDRLTPGSVDMTLYRTETTPTNELRMLIYVGGGDLALGEVMPVLHSFDLEVLDEHPRAIRRPDGLRCMIYDFGLRLARPLAWTEDPDAALTFRDRFTEAFHATRRGDAESDGFNALVLAGGLTWRQVTILRAYAHYLRQIRFPYSQQRIERVLLDNIAATRALVGLFETRFALPGTVPALGATAGQVEALVQDVLNLEADRILRAYLSLIHATVRTSYHRTDNGTARPYLTFKIDTTSVAEVPEPKPHVETFVYSPRFEGTHLRFGTVARGGLRWSDRQEDFRTEILGLVKAQAVKNAVIVPAGAKGGFVVKRLGADRAALDPGTLRTEGPACYELFIAALLDVTDNLDVHGEVIPPPQVQVLDEPDPYLVVAADKGTAKFSDLANAVAARYRFWLGDAFASGGSVGYDHKQMGITARGAWESVTCHFRERGIDVQRDSITVVGIGDMSGDVFGNGMLLSSSLRLIAAFDHRHIFIDPDPDPETSFAERRRLFGLDHSSWADYDRALISDGGGVWSRDTKSIPLTPQIATALGIDADVTVLSPPELIQRILTAPVDLLWNGGIGTYIKAHDEAHADVGDKANDHLRVDARALRVWVIGEGGNLGLTARARIEFASHGGAVNTDAIDNSAGVDCSDHEVNIKILLDSLVRDRALAAQDRNVFLADMTDDVAQAVLANNISQNRLIGESRQNAPSQLDVHRRLMTQLEERGVVDRELDTLPDIGELDRRRQAGTGLTSPELATVIAHTKLAYKTEIAASELPDTGAYLSDLRAYFPKQLIDRFGRSVEQHPLRREITTNAIVNAMVDNGGVTFAFRLGEETGANTVDAARAYRIVTETFDLPRMWQDIATAQLPSSVEYALVTESRRLLDRAARWFLANRPQPLAIPTEVDRFAAAVSTLAPHVGDLLRGAEAAAVHTNIEHWQGQGVPAPLARKVSELLYWYSTLDIVEVAAHTGHCPTDVAALYFALSDHLSIDPLLIAISKLPRDSRWSALARLALRDDLYRSLRTVTLDVLHHAPAQWSPDQLIRDWEVSNPARLSRARATLHDIAGEATFDLPTLVVAAHQVRAMARGLAAHT
jgi:glutamate dehydrogenase